MSSRLGGRWSAAWTGSDLVGSFRNRGTGALASRRHAPSLKPRVFTRPASECLRPSKDQRLRSCLSFVPSTEYVCFVMTLNDLIMKPKTMVSAKQEILPSARGSVLVNNPNGNRTVIANSNEIMRCKRKLGYVQGQPYPGAQPASVARRNARERNRVKQVNNGFATLRSHIPPAVAAAISTEKPSSRSSAASKKLSKVETLKMAVEYIRSLQELLEEHGGCLEKKADMYELDEERYYSSSPETVVSGESHYYPNSPEVTKSEPPESGYYSPERVVKNDNYHRYNPEVHETLTSEFYHARSPPKPFSSSPDREPPEAHTNLLVAPHSFLQPRVVRDHRGSSSLSPPMSDACPSPTPSYASDNSSLHPGSTSSGQLTSQLSRLTTMATVQPRRDSPGYENYEPMSPEDEELLDVISWWQQSN